jgi:hypothetical protein
MSLTVPTLRNGRVEAMTSQGGFAMRARVRVLVGLALVVAMTALAGCGRFGDGNAGSGGPSNDPDTTEMTLEAQALEEIGFTQQEIGPAPTPSASEKDDGTWRPRHKRVPFAFRKDMLHGEAVVQTDEGTKTVVVQRGTVTAIDASTVTVKSSDGFTLKWTFGSPLHVVEHRTQIQPSAIAVGTDVGVAGIKQGDTAVARLIVVPRKK